MRWALCAGRKKERDRETRNGRQVDGLSSDTGHAKGSNILFRTYSEGLF